MAKQLYTNSKARLTLIREDQNNLHWLFVPGGPGLGSESLRDLTALVDLPGKIWHFDFPGDGSNISSTEQRLFSNWRQGLLEATQLFENVIVVGHSCGGMFALSMPELEQQLKGLVLISSQPDTQFHAYFAEYMVANPIAGYEDLEKEFDANPSDAGLKQLTAATAPYFSTKACERKLKTLINSLPINCKSFLWSRENFDFIYQAKWVPQKIPTLIFTGEEDHLTPIQFFRENAEFQRENIRITTVKDAAHFPWMENPVAVKRLFDEYKELLFGTSSRTE